MRKIIYFCDKCGKEIKSENEVVAVYEHELCEKCFGKFEVYIKSFFKNERKFEVETPEEAEIINEVSKMVKYQKPEVISKPKSKIDWDKACALKIAGWTNKSIAEELNANEGTINTLIYSKVEQYKDGKRFNAQEVETSEEE